jgi:hypothetical protein
MPGKPKPKSKSKSTRPVTPTPAPSASAESYPIGLTIEYPSALLDRASTFFRPILIIPICIILGLLLSGGSGIQVSVLGFVVLPTLLMLLFRQKYPKWWYDWNFNLVGFATRVMAYAALLGDQYPATDAEQTVHLRWKYPNAKTELNRWLPLVKWLLAVPHYIVLTVLSLLAAAMIVLAWFAILFTGKYPQTLFDFVTGVMRWHLRVAGYVLLLTTDIYPPFRLEE